MGTKKNDILQGTLVLLILQSLASNKRLHGYAVTAHIHDVSASCYVRGGSLPGPSPHRAGGLGEGQWGKTGKKSRGPILFVDLTGQKAAHAGRGKLETTYGGCGAGNRLRVASRRYAVVTNGFGTSYGPAASPGTWNANSRHVTGRTDELWERGRREAHANRAARLQFGNFTTQVERTREVDITGGSNRSSEISGMRCVRLLRLRHSRSRSS